MQRVHGALNIPWVLDCHHGSRGYRPYRSSRVVLVRTTRRRRRFGHGGGGTCLRCARGIGPTVAACVVRGGRRTWKTRRAARRGAFLLDDRMDHLSQLLGQRPGAAAETEQLNHEVTTDTSVWAAGLHVGESYNGAKPSAWDDTYLASMPAKAAPRVSLAVSTDLKQWNYRYMFEKKGERSLELDSRLNEMADVLQQAFGLSQEWEDPSIPNQASIFTVGRICTRLDPVPSAAKATEAAPQDVPSQKLTATNLVLETSRMVGNGQRVSLALDPKCMVRYAWSDEATQASSLGGLFPGMIVGLKGRNGSGNKFVAEELLMVRARGG